MRRQLGKIEPVPKKWLSKAEAMAYLDCSEDFLKTLRDNALVSYSQFGSKMIWYDLQSIERFVQRHKVINV